MVLVVVVVVIVAWEYFEIVAGIFKREYLGATVIRVYDLHLHFDRRLTACHSNDSCRLGTFLESSTIISVVLVTMEESSEMTSACKGAREITSCDIPTMTSARLDGRMTYRREVPTMAFGSCVPRMTLDGKLAVAFTIGLTFGG